MSERPSTASTPRPASAQSPSSITRPSTSGGGANSSPGTPPPSIHNNENRRVTASATSSSPRPKSKADAQTPCRNIVIYGYCRYQDKGCTFNHDTDQSRKTTAVLDSLKRKLNVDSPTFTPAASSVSTITPKALEAIPFTPKAAGGQQHEGNGYLTAAMDAQVYPLQQGFETMTIDTTAGTAGAMLPYTDYSSVQQVNPYAHNGTDMFFQQPSTYTQPLQYHLYAPVGPHKQNLDTNQRNIHNLFISDNLREELQRKSEASLQTLQSSIASSLSLLYISLSPSSSRGENRRRNNKNSLRVSKDVGLPQIDSYHSLVPLDMTNQKSTQLFGLPSWVYKAFSSSDGRAYALRRVEGFRLRDPKDITIVQRWKKVHSANVVALFDAFTTTRFGDSSIIFVYAYHPLSKTLADEHFGPNPRYLPSRHPNGSPAVPEQVIWSYMVQIASALKQIHSMGLAMRVLEPSKILLTSKMRIRLNCCGMMDVMAPDQRNIQEHQQNDLVSFGRLILCIACNTLAAAQNPHKSLDYVTKHYSADVKNAIIYLIGIVQQPNTPLKSIDEFISRYAFSHFAQNFDSALHYEDQLEGELCRELEDARLVRLLIKFGFINERPEFDHDRNWSESGDRYLIKLFRDYVFHSVDEHGQPVVDMAHVLSCLNKLDAGVDEKVMLVSRDEQNCFIVSYKEIKRAVDAAFMDLTKASRR